MMQQKKNGYTLIELLVSISVFAIVVTMVSGAFTITLKGQNKTATVQNVADNIRYAMEVIAKEVRMGDSFPPPGTHSDFTFTSNMPARTGNQVRFRLDNGRIMFDDDTNPATAPEDSLTSSSNVNITALSFIVDGQYPTTQPRVTIVIEAESIGTKVDVATQIQTQTTVSPRSL